MFLSKVQLVNWKNFHSCTVDLSERTFVVGANASGKSNFLDVFRFLHDVARIGGGLQTAVALRGGITKIRCLAARSRTDVEIEVTFKESPDRPDTWKYSLAFRGVGGGIMKKEVTVIKEVVSFGKDIILERTKDTAGEDSETLKYTHLEQGASNLKFRELKNYFDSIEYLNIVPQFVRESATTFPQSTTEDYYGRDFLHKLSLMNKATSASYLRRVNEVLRIAVPQLDELRLIYDEQGHPHLEVRCEHWRAKGSKQREEQFSDGTLRLIGFLFSLMNSKGIVLLEEPETNLHSAVVAQLPNFISKLQRSKKGTRQVLITTHSYEMLDNPGIGSDEVVLLRPSKEGTDARNAATLEDVNNELRAGLTMADAITPYTKPQDVDELSNIRF